MNGWLFVGLMLFGWSTKPVPDRHGQAAVEVVAMTIGSALIAVVMS